MSGIVFFLLTITVILTIVYLDEPRRNREWAQRSRDWHDAAAWRNEHR